MTLRLVLLILGPGLCAAAACALPSWELLGPPGGDGPIELTPNPHQPDQVLGLWLDTWDIQVRRSTDAGRSWATTLGPTSDCDLPGLHLAWDAQAEGVAYTGVSRIGDQAIAYRSLDSGGSWDRIVVLDRGARGWLTADNSVGGRLFAGFRGEGLWRSIDGGESFQRVEGGQGDYCGATWSDPADPDHVLVVSKGVFLSQDGGQHFSLLSSDISAQVGGLFANPQDPGQLLCAAARAEWQELGIWRSENRGADWHLELALNSFPVLAVDPESGQAFAASDRDGLFRRGPDEQWQPATLPGGAYIKDAAMVGAETRSLLTSTRHGVFRNESLLAEDWENSSAGLQELAPVAIDVEPHNSARILIEEDGTLLLSEDGGDTWKHLDDGSRPYRSLGATLLAGGWIVSVDDANGVGWSGDGGLSWIWEQPDWYVPFEFGLALPDEVWASRGEPTRPLVLMNNGMDLLTLYAGPTAPYGSWTMVGEAGVQGCQAGGDWNFRTFCVASSWNDESAVRVIGKLYAMCHGGFDFETWYELPIGDPSVPAPRQRTAVMDAPADAPEQWMSLAPDLNSQDRCLYRWLGYSWRLIGRGGVINQFLGLRPLSGAEGNAWVAIGYEGSWLSRDLGVRWEEIDTSIPLPFTAMTTAWLPTGTVLAAGSGGVYRLRGLPTGVSGPDQEATTPQPTAHLGRPWPVPANPHLTTPFALSHPGATRLLAYDLRGALVRTIVDQELPAGDHQALWDGRNELGRRAASGIYLIRLEAGGEVHQVRVLLLF